ncbi:MAG: 3,4-dihydroxy-2-butanone-4-phosphate synthase, partial [Candidatus Levyibacteriota bacterium]
MNKYLSTIPEAIEEIKKGNMLIVLDTHREHEADFFIPAAISTPQHVLTMIRCGGGLICVAMVKEQAYRLQLPLMVVPEENKEKTKLNITVSVNAKNGITTGISAFDRAKTIQILGNIASEPLDIVMPGHVFGLIAKDGGVLERGGHTETAVDLSRLAGFAPAGVLCEIIGDDGKMAELPELVTLAQKLNIKITTIQDLISYLRKNPLPQVGKKVSIQKITHAKLPTKYGVFTIFIYTSLEDQREHVVLIKGKNKNPALVRIHSQCMTGEIFGSMRCDCGMQLQKSMEIIEKNGNGILIYLN